MLLWSTQIIWFECKVTISTKSPPLLLLPATFNSLRWTTSIITSQAREGNNCRSINCLMGISPSMAGSHFTQLSTRLRCFLRNIMLMIICGCLIKKEGFAFGIRKVLILWTILFFGTMHRKWERSRLLFIVESRHSFREITHKETSSLLMGSCWFLLNSV